MNISIIGIGKLGGALALALRGKNFKIDFLVSRNSAKIGDIVHLTDSTFLLPDDISQINSDLIIIATQDSEIENVAANLAAKLKNKPTVLHTSGSLSSEILNNLKNIGCQTGSFHPLVSISDSFLGKERFQNAYFCVEGSKKAIEAGKRIAETLGGNCFSIKTENKILYHASAVTVCGHLVSLFDISLEMLKKCGLEETQAKKILMPLVESTIENLKKQTPENALTGTFARADYEIFQKHLTALRENVSENALETYLQLGLRSLDLAGKIAVQEEKLKNLDKIRKSILLAKKNLR